MRILLSAYACEPGRGSEPGVGWGWACALSEAGHEVDVLTRASNRDAIEAELAERPRPGLNFHWHDLSAVPLALKRAGGGVGLRLYYAAWQWSAVSVLRRIAAQQRCESGHHVTFAQYWSPCALAHSGLPFIWGPVGGGERLPPAFWPRMGVRGFLYEASRAVFRDVAARAGGVRSTARRCSRAVASTRETAERLSAAGACEVLTMSQVALPADVFERLSGAPQARWPQRPFRFFSLGDLLAHKGLDLAFEALSRVRGDWTLEVVGDGPCRRRLESRARALGIDRRVRFAGALPRSRALERLATGHALLFPALHDSGGLAVAEAMAAGLPVICLALGGPAELVTSESGCVVPAPDPATAIDGLAQAAQSLIDDSALLARLSSGAMSHARANLIWPARVSALYPDLAAKR